MTILFLFNLIFDIGDRGKESTCNERPKFDPWVGKIPWRRERVPTPLPGLENPLDYHKELDMTEQLSLSQRKRLFPQYVKNHIFIFDKCPWSFFVCFISELNLILAFNLLNVNFKTFFCSSSLLVHLLLIFYEILPIVLEKYLYSEPYI